MMVISHNKARKKDMEVCIEGGGPTGLMCAISQYGAGANVSLLKKETID
jgi:predicted flavoprotein YhiN